MHLKTKGILSQIKKGLYTAGPGLTNDKPDLILLANHILGPSYVSMETALSHYGMIPERVFEITSMCTKSSREFHTLYGTFSYRQLPLTYYALGIRSTPVSTNQFALMATPEKAICDKIVTTPGTIRSIASAYNFLVENLRMDEFQLRKLDLESIRKWLVVSPKSSSIYYIIKMIERL
ncbi:type IV toxin-antitoxin system AbiEi family antitoxin domain-containing protein [Echinicola soli]|nr:hypothetical protein [Echinicola soli]